MKKLLCSLLILTMTPAAMADSPYDKSVEAILEQYNYNKDKNVASDALIRCTALINLTNMISAAPEGMQIDPNELFVAVVTMRANHPEKSAPTVTIEEFRSHSKQYSAWFKDAAGDQGNPFDSPELKKEFEICDEAAREFLGK